MLNITIISDDICLINKIISCINIITKFPIITIYNPIIFKNKILPQLKSINNNIYLIDIYKIEPDFLKITSMIKNLNNSNKIGIININKDLKSIIEAQKNIDFTIEKDGNFYKNLKINLTKILSHQHNEKIIISNQGINITITKSSFNDIYNFSNKKLSINYQNYDNNILIPTKRVTPQIKKATNNKFYIPKKEIKKQKRIIYSEPIKQLLVDLYLTFKMDGESLSKHFQVEAKYIKKWSTLSKYNRKINVPFQIIGKIIIKSYLKKQKKG